MSKKTKIKPKRSGRVDLMHELQEHLALPIELDMPGEIAAVLKTMNDHFYSDNRYAEINARILQQRVDFFSGFVMGLRAGGFDESQIKRKLWNLPWAHTERGIFK